MTTSPEFDRLLAALQKYPAQPGVPVETLRAGHEAVHAARPPADDVTVAPVDAGGVPAEFVSVGPASSDRTLVYVHGGGFALGSLATARPFAAELARAIGVRVLSVDYRLAPEVAHPAALEDSVAAYRYLLEIGVDAGDIALCGDSAGGGLCIATIVTLRDTGIALPAACVCLSPWTDLAMPGKSFASNADRDPQVSRAMLAEFADAYAGGEDLSMPLISPVHANLTGLPPVLVQVGGAEALLDDGVAFAERAVAQRVDVTIRVWDDMIHVWQVYAPRLPEARAAVIEVAHWLETVWSTQ